MNTPITLLFALDFNIESQTILDQLLPFVKQWDANLVLLHVLKTTKHHPTPTVKQYATARGKLLEIHDQLQRQGVSCLPMVGHETSIADGIVQAAHAHDVDMIVLGFIPKAGGKAAKHHMAEQILRHSVKPVWLFQGPASFPYARLLCAIDFSPPSKRALRHSLLLARQFKAALTILHVLTTAEAMPPAAARARVEALLQQEDLAGLTYTIRIEEGSVPDLLTQVIKAEHPGLLMTGTTGERHLDHYGLGHVVHHILAQLPCSLMTFKSENFSQHLLDHLLQRVEGDFEHAKELLEKGFAQEAVQIFESLADQNMMFAPAWEGLARAHRLLGHETLARDYDRHVQLIRERLCWKKIEYDVKHQYQPGSQKRT